MRAPGAYRSAMWLLHHPTTDHPRGERPSGHADGDNARIAPSHDQTGSKATTEASQSGITTDIHDGSASASLLPLAMLCKLLAPGRSLEIVLWLTL
jgi:hypothetical protein